MKENLKKGLLSGLGAYILWGILPIYWKWLGNVNPFEVLANRFIWSAVFIGCLICGLGRRELFVQECKAVFSTTKSACFMAGAAVMIAFNWGIFIWAVADGRIIETSMGYYITPLVSILFGVVLLKEELVTLQKLAVLCAFIGVSYYVWEMGYLPWVSLTLALTFSTYGYLKKCLPLAPLNSIMLETLIIMPLVLAYLTWVHLHTGTAYELMDARTIGLLICAGAVTATPLLLFTAAAKALPLKIIGFLQYLAPCISMTIGVMLYGEAFTRVHAVTFSWVWLGLIFFSWAQFKRA